MLPLRQLFARVPNRLVRLKPCLMMSPLAVSTYLESPEFQFDVVIFDEASQVLPWDAIGAVYRGRQLVVAGDQKQLPPSTFFDRMVNDDDLVTFPSPDDLDGSTAVEFFAFQQKLHRRKSHCFVAQSTQDMNQNRHDHQRSPRYRDGRVEEELGDKGHGGESKI